MDYYNFADAIFTLSQYTSVFAYVSHFHPSEIYAGKTWAYQSRAPYQSKL